MAACNHNHFDVSATVVRSNDTPTRFKTDLKVTCLDCGLPFRFGRSYVSATDGLELTALLWPGPLKVNRQLPDDVLKEMAAWSG
jgi:hypothetical protein